LRGEAEGELGGLGWAAAWIGTEGLKGGTKKQEKAPASARVGGVER